MSNIHPLAAKVLSWPLLVEGRLPARLQMVDLEAVFASHLVLTFVATCFTVHPSYTFPLTILGFIVTSRQFLPSGPDESNLLVVFSLLWLTSVFADMTWLSRHSGQATDLVSFAVGMNMCLKVISAVACSTALLHVGVLDTLNATGGAGLPQSGRFSGGSALGSDSSGRSRTGLSFSSQSTLVDGRGAVSGAGRSAPADDAGRYTDEDVEHVERNAGGLNAGDEDAKVVDSKVLFDHEAASEDDDQPPRQSSGPQGGYHTIE